MYECICAAVTTEQVDTVILAGARTVSEIGDRCGAGTGCGSCVDRLDCLLEVAEARTNALDLLPRSA